MAALRSTSGARTDDELFARRLIRIVALTCCGCGLVWSAMYTAVFGVGPTMALPLVFVAVVGTALAWSYWSGGHVGLVYTQLLCITWISALIQWSIGGTVQSGMVICWSFLGPIGALLFLDLRRALVFMAMFLGITVYSAVAEPELLGHPLAVSGAARALFLTMNIAVALSVVFAAAAWFVWTLNRERARSDRLVAEMLPASIARRLKDGAAMIADAHPQVTILFADIAGFTDYSSSVTPATLVSELNAVFARFDALAAQHGVEKIKTIGDAYMAVTGALDARPDHAAAMARFALALQGEAAGILRGDGQAFQLRVGMHSGPAVGGVIGVSKRVFDLWGDTVNTASRMESHGEIGRIQVSAATAALLAGTFAVESRGEIAVKGKGAMAVYFLGDEVAGATRR